MTGEQHAVDPDVVWRAQLARIIRHLPSVRHSPRLTSTLKGLTRFRGEPPHACSRGSLGPQGVNAEVEFVSRAGEVA